MCDNGIRKHQEDLAMKKFKEYLKQLREIMGEAMLELFMYLFFIGIGCAVFALFGQFDAFENQDGDTLILVGILAFVVVVTVICKIIDFFKKK